MTYFDALAKPIVVGSTLTSIALIAVLWASDVLIPLPREVTIPLLLPGAKYVSPSGSDLSGDGSSVRPYKTLRHAIKKHGVSYDFMQKVGGTYQMVPNDAMCVWRESR